MKNMIKKNRSKYEAVGFVEALIAIMVSGVAATVLLNIAAMSMRELIRLDMQDALSQHARSGATIVQNIANREALDETGTLFEALNENSCYKLILDEEEEYELDTEELGSNRTTYTTEAVIPTDPDFPGDEEEYFRVVCIENKNIDERKLLIKILTGVVKMKGEVTNASDIKDFEYFAVINL